MIIQFQTTNKQCPSWPTGWEVMTTSSCWVRGCNSTPSPTVQKHSSKSYRRARQRCFWLLAFISRTQVRNIHLPGRMILPGSLIPSDKYFLKNLTFVVCNPLVWLRHHSSQTLSVTIPVKLFPFDWNGDVATRVDCVPQRLNSLRNIYAKG